MDSNLHLELMAKNPGEDFEFEEPSEPCLSCFIAEWMDFYGTWVYACDMHHCIKADDIDEY